MPAAVETMAYAHETPWHGLGTKVSPDLSEEEFLKVAGLDWRVVKRPLSYVDPSNGQTCILKTHEALCRETDGRVLSTVTRQWHPVQNKDLFHFFKSFVEAGEAKMETAGSLRNGEIIWGLAKICEYELPGGDKMVGHLLAASSHVPGRSTIFKNVQTRVVCANTLAHADREMSRFEARYTHRTEFDVADAREAMGLSREAAAEFAKKAEKLQKVVLSRDEAIRILAPIYQPDEDVELLVSKPEAWNPTLTNIWISSVRAPGATPGTAWGLLNGVTYWTSHVANKNADARLASAWLGSESNRQGKVFGELIKLAA